jgi:Predicted membrane protein
VGLGASLVSAVGYWNPSLWTDEAATISDATRTLPQLWTLIHHIDAVHALYYLFMHFWTAVFGIAPWSIRLPSILAVGMAAAGMVVLGRLVATPRLGLYAGAVFALLPRVTWAGGEARSSAAAGMVAVWLTVVLVRAAQRGRAWWALYAALAAFGVLLFLFLALVVVAQGITIAWEFRGRCRQTLRWALAAGAAGVALVPFLLLALPQSGQIIVGKNSLVGTSANVLIDQPFLGSIPTRGHDFVLDPPYNWGIAAMVVSGMCWLFAAWALLRYRGSARSEPGIGLIKLAVPSLLVPTAVILLYSLVKSPIYHPRYFIISAPAMSLLLAAGLSTLAGRRTAFVALAGVVTLALPIYSMQRGVYAKASDWKQVAQIIDQRALPGDVVVYGKLADKQSQTTRQIEIAYRGRLSQLRDITLRRTGIERNDPWPSSRPLSAVVHTVDGAPRVWLIVDPAPGFAALIDGYRHTLAVAGYRVTWSWRGPFTQVDELVPIGP